MTTAFLSAMPLEAALAVAAVLIAMALAAGGSARRSQRLRAEGRIVDLVPAQNEDSPFDEVYPVVEFEGANGLVRVTVRERLSRALHETGKTIALAYDPRNPERVELAF